MSQFFSLLDQTPYDARFDDLYVSKAGGLSESQYVFLEQNKIAERIQSRKEFYVLELGFGVGLNAILTRRLFKNNACKLHYYTCERFPITHEQALTALRTQVELADEEERFVRQWPLWYLGDRALYKYGLKSLKDQCGTFQLYLGDVLKALKEYQALGFGKHRTFDAVFLDGFSPAKNPEMWSREVFEAIARISNSDTTLSTYSASSMVRKNLTDAGFRVEKRPGFGTKREMLVAQASHSASGSKLNPWFDPPTGSLPSGSRVAIIGAGLAGCMLASELQQEGCEVTLYDQNSEILSEASAHESLVYSPSLAHGEDAISALTTLGYELWIAETRSQKSLPGVSPTGLFQTAEDEEARFKKILDTFQFSPEFVRFEKNGIWFSHAGHLKLREYFGDKLGPAVKFMGSKKLESLTHEDAQWKLYFQDHEDSYDAVVLCSSLGMNAFSQTQKLALKGIRGQADLFRAQTDLKHGLTFGKTITPAGAEKVWVGATFVRDDHTTEPREAEREENFQTLKQKFPNSNPEHLKSFVGIRSSTQDTLPLIGAVPDWDFYSKHYSDLHFGRYESGQHTYASANYHDGLYVMTALGSKGSVYSKIGARMLAALMMGRALPVQRELMESVHPARFWIRNFKRLSRDEINEGC